MICVGLCNYHANVNSRLWLLLIPSTMHILYYDYRMWKRCVVGWMTWWQDTMASCLERAREVWKDKRLSRVMRWASGSEMNEDEHVWQTTQKPFRWADLNLTVTTSRLNHKGKWNVSFVVYLSDSFVFSWICLQIILFAVSELSMLVPDAWQELVRQD